MSLTHAPQPTTAAADQAEPAVAPVAPAHVTPVAGLLVGSADDRAERDADALADVVLRRLHAGATPSGAGSEGPADDVHGHDSSCGHLRRSAVPTPSAVVGAAGGALDAATSGQIAARTGGGRGLPDGIRRSMEGAFGTGLSHVRIHDDSTSASLNQAVSARAFTTGSDIFFGAGQYAPHDSDGQRVLAHELAHVVTEGGGAPVRRDTATTATAAKPASKSILGGWSDAFSGLFKSKTPEQKEQEAAAELVKKEAAADAKKIKDEAKAAKVKDAKTVSGHQKLERSTAKTNEKARKEGIAGRQAISDTIVNAGDADRVATAKALLDAQMDESLAAEKELAAELTTANPAWTDDKVIDEAFKQIWLEGFRAKNLFHVRPTRETVAERLVREIRDARNHAAVASSINEAESQATKLGTMLPEPVEILYEKYVLALQAATSAVPPLSLEVAEKKAAAETWGAAPEKISSQRPPKDSALDVRAIMDARVRLAGSPRAEVTDTEKADAFSDKAGGYVDKGAEAVGKVQSAIASKGQAEDTKLDAANTGDPLSTKDPLGAGELVAGAKQAAENLKTGNRSGEGPTYPQSVQTKAAEGIGTVTDVFTSLTSSVDGIIKFVKALEDSQKAKDPRKDLAAAKAGLDGLGQLVDSAKKTAKLAVLIDSSVESSVKQVIPGLNIVSAVISVASNAMTLADKSKRMDEANKAILQARLSDPDASKVNVLVYPLLRVASKYTKNLEQASWTTAVSISQVVTSIATVASAGGFGIPAAVDLGVGVLDKLHDLGHFIADEYMTFLSKKASDASVGALEGSAEQVLTHNPGTAVDGIILRAAGKDPVALAFLANYAVDGAAVDAVMLAKVHRTSAPAAPLAKGPTKAGPQGAASAVPVVLEQDMLFKIRQAVLDEMGDDADPEYAYQTYKKKAVAISDKWAATGAMADQRNRMDDQGPDADTKPGGRGIFWRLKMLVKGEEKFGRSAKKTEVNWESAAKGGAVRDTGVALVCGPYQLPAKSTEADQKAFLEGVDGLSDAVIIAAATNKENSEEGRAILIKIVQDRLHTKVAHAGASKAGA